mmetsp:Transcript_26964/g.20173  ORF Transcript_26964/g.20173 Transcript_26964/m.20173 type:complete len:84 (+) Transcript_26964:76-327(+)
MASGFGVNGQVSRCFYFYQDFRVCLFNGEDKSVCNELGEDYLECLHNHRVVHRKNYIMQQKLKQEQAALNGSNVAKGDGGGHH